MMFLTCRTDPEPDWMNDPLTIEDFSKRYDCIRASIKQMQKNKGDGPSS